VTAAVTVLGPARVSEYAAALRRKREETGVVLADIARKTGFDIAELLRMETGAIALEARAFSRISAAIGELAREKTHG
jgi:transcriptional regulator with XRE-family HTH domain